MNSHSQETLRRVTQDDPSLTELRLVNNNNNNYSVAGQFYSDNSDDYSTLGSAIANNTHLDRLSVTLSDGLPLGVADREFYDGLKSNSSISTLSLRCNRHNIAGGVGQEILQTYQENNSHLIRLHIERTGLQNGGDRFIVDTLRSCKNIQQVTLFNCNITDAQLLPMVDAVRGHRMLESLRVVDNNIGNVGCEAIATLLIDPNCNLRDLNLGFNNDIGNEGATAIANSLTNNNKLQQLYLVGNQIDQSAQNVFSNILCNTSSINSLYASNHTLNELNFDHVAGQQLESLLELNECDTKSFVTIRKILKYHPNIDMGPFFEWGMEEGGEHSLKALPYVIDWFDRAEEAVAYGEGDSRSSSDESNEEDEYNTEERKLSAIFQFAKSMPLLFVHTSNIKIDNKKRKRSEGS